MLAIKFKRTGKKHQASFRVVVAEKRSKLQGRFVEDLGWFDPKSKKSEVKKDRLSHWLKIGAKPTATVHNLLIKLEAITGTKIPVHKKSKKAVEPNSATETTTATVKKEIPPTETVTESSKNETKTESPAPVDTNQS